MLARASPRERRLLVALGACLAAMNCSFYLALDRLPIGLVAAIEFVGTIGVALCGLRTARNLAALAVAVSGIFILIDVRWASDPMGLFWACLNGALFVGYVVLGHRIAGAGASGGVERLGAAMAAAFLFVLPIGLVDALRVFRDPVLLLAGVGVGVCSSVVPYVCDQLAMSRLPRASFALLLALLPATATIVGVVVLAQVPSAEGPCGRAPGHGRRRDPPAPTSARGGRRRPPRAPGRPARTATADAATRPGPPCPAGGRDPGPEQPSADPRRLIDP